MNKRFTMLDQRFDVGHILSSTIQQGVQRGKCLVTKQRLILFDRRSQTLLECLMPSSVEFIS